MQSCLSHHQLRIITMLMSFALVILGMSKTSLAVERSTTMTLHVKTSEADSASPLTLSQRPAPTETQDKAPAQSHRVDTPKQISVGMCGPSAQSINAPTPLVAAVTPTLTQCETAEFKQLSKTFELPEPAEIEKENLQPSVGLSLSTAQTIAASQVSTKLQRQALCWLTRQDLRRLLRPPIA
jgi:hypothetical protein